MKKHRRCQACGRRHKPSHDRLVKLKTPYEKGCQATRGVKVKLPFAINIIKQGINLLKKERKAISGKS